MIDLKELDREYNELMIDREEQTYSASLDGCRNYTTDEGNGAAAAVFAGRYARRMYGRDHDCISLREVSQNMNDDAIHYQATFGRRIGNQYWSVSGQIQFTVRRA